MQWRICLLSSPPHLGCFAHRQSLGVSGKQHPWLIPAAAAALPLPRVPSCVVSGEVRVVGCTSGDKYRKFIEKDPGLERRFQVCVVWTRAPTGCCPNPDFRSWRDSVSLFTS